MREHRAAGGAVVASWAEEGVDVLVGVIETHDRPDLVAKVGGLEVVPCRQVVYRGVSLEES